MTRMPRSADRSTSHSWELKARFRRRAFGWRSQPAIQRVKQAVAEIRKVAGTNASLAAEGGVSFLERVSPALEQVDSSSGAIGTAVNHAIAALVPIIAGAPADAKTRARWLERLWEAHAADEIPYIEALADSWGELCGSEEVASVWADRLLGITRLALSPDKDVRGHFHGTSACLSALYRAERYAEILRLLEVDTIWPYKRWAVQALAAMGKIDEAIRYAESCRTPWASAFDIDRLCEALLLSCGRADEAYLHYGMQASQAGTHLATFRAVAQKYPTRSAAEILADLVQTTPGEEGKWFAPAKDAKLYDEALSLASRTPSDPRTLTRAARDHAEKNPPFAVGAGLLALHWLVQGYGYDITAADVWAAYRATMQAAEQQGSAAETRARIRTLLAGETSGERFVTKVLGRELGLSAG